MPVNTYTCLGCSLKAMEPGFGLRFAYQVDDLSVPIKHSTGWCHECEGVAPIEVFDSPEELLTLEGKREALRKERDAELTRIEQSRRWWQRRGQRTSVLVDLDWQIERMERQAMVIQQRLSCLDGRRSPPRCLQCGSTDAFPFAVIPDFTVYYGKTQGPVALGVKHPGCGGELAVMDDGTRFSYIPTLRLYDSEGNRCVDV